MNDLVLLAALLQGPAHGYALKKTAGLMFGRADIHNNIIYPSLKRFVRNQWVTESDVAGDRGQRRKQYQLTPKGRKHLLEQAAAFGGEAAGNPEEFLLRFALFALLSREQRTAIIAARRTFLTERVKELTQLQDQIRPVSFGRLALARVQDLVLTELKWIYRIENQTGV